MQCIHIFVIGDVALKLIINLYADNKEVCDTAFQNTIPIIGQQ